VKCVRKWDPDILGGYEVSEMEMFNSWSHVPSND
jgi:hypothetical protein